MAKTRSRRIFLSLVGACLWVIFVLPIVLTRYQNESGDAEVYQYNDEDDRIILFMSFQSIDPNARKVNLYSHIIPQGKYENKNGTLSQNVRCNLRYSKANLVKDTFADPIAITVPLIFGTVKDYPFEEFETSFPINCQDESDRKVPISIIIERSLTSYVPKVEFKEYSNLNKTDVERIYLVNEDSISVNIRLHQSKSVKALSLFIIFIMWGLAISYGIIVFDVISVRREIPPPLLAIGISMLFALPALRNSQPGVPYMGCISDVAGFFWCITIIAISTMVNLFAFALRWRKSKTQNL